MLRRIANRNRSQMLQWISRLAWSFFLVALTVGLSRIEASSQSSPQEILRKGMIYYNSDDTNDKAAIQFRLILARYNTSPEAESAQYYLANYYQRKFYILQRNQGRQDTLSLVKARNEYGYYTKRYFKNDAKWLSDAFFNLALVYFQLSDPKKAGWELDKMRKFAGMDPHVYVYQLVWSPDADDVIDAHYPAEALADFVRSNPEKSFPNLIEATKRWCRSMKTK